MKESPDWLDYMIGRAGLILLLGIAFVALDRLVGTGVLTGVGLMSLGAFLASLQNYKIERGLWILAALFGMVSFFMYGAFEFAAASDAWHGRNTAWQLVLDAAGHTYTQWLSAHAGYKACRINLSLRTPQDSRPQPECK